MRAASITLQTLSCLTPASAAARLSLSARVGSVGRCELDVYCKCGGRNASIHSAMTSVGRDVVIFIHFRRAFSVLFPVGWRPGRAGPGRHRLLPVAPAICLELTRTKRGAACGGDAGGTASPSVRPSVRSANDAASGRARHEDIPLSAPSLIYRALTGHRPTAPTAVASPRDRSTAGTRRPGPARRWRPLDVCTCPISV